MTLTEEEKNKIEQKRLFRAEEKGYSAWGCLALIVIGILLSIIFSISKVDKLENVVGKYAYNKTNGVYIGVVSSTKDCDTVPTVRCYEINYGEGYQKNYEHPVDNVTVRNTPPNSEEKTVAEDEWAKIEESRQENISNIADVFCKNRQGEYLSGYFFCFGCVDLKTIATYFQLSQGESTTISNAKAPAKKEDCDKVAELCLNYWSNQECVGVAGRKLWIGMSLTQLEVSMGIPKDENNTVGSWGTHSQWVYGDSTYVYLEGKDKSDMVVTSWQD